jgi:hypothetical protein
MRTLTKCWREVTGLFTGFARYVSIYRQYGFGRIESVILAAREG